MEPTNLALATGWIEMLGGVASGVVMGLHFHKENWLGGYTSFRRRLARLGHISFFGIGFINLLFAFTLRAMPVPTPFGEFAALGLALAAVTMPLTCFLAAWRPDFRQLFPVPVVGLLSGIVMLLAGWIA
jgi:hypothetical protein